MSNVRFALPPVRNWATRLAILHVLASAVWGLIWRAGLMNPYLSPVAVTRRLSLWQLVTYVPVEVPSDGVVMAILFNALILWSIGGSLEVSWGAKRLLWFCGLVPLLAGVLTVGLSLFVPGFDATVFGGGSVVTSSVWVAYGLLWGQRQTNFWGIPVTGNVFAIIGLLFAGLSAVFHPWQTVAPVAFGLLITFTYLKAGAPTDWWLRFSSWRLRRHLASRAKHLKVVEPDRNTSRGSDRYLH